MRTPTSADISGIPSPVVVLALGSWEQHGPHLPLDTDTRIASELVSRLARRVSWAIPGPALGIASSGEHAGFAGTLSVGGRVVADTVLEIVRSADWAAGVAIVNGHGGNGPYLERAREIAVSEGRNLFTWSPPLVDPRDSHAGYVETSVMMAIDPATVRLDEIECGTVVPLEDVLPRMREGGVISVSPSGVLGDPRRADASLGDDLLTSWENDLVESASTWRHAITGLAS